MTLSSPDHHWDSVLVDRPAEYKKFPNINEKNNFNPAIVCVNLQHNISNKVELKKRDYHLDFPMVWPRAVRVINDPRSIRKTKYDKVFLLIFYFRQYYYRKRFNWVGIWIRECCSERGILWMNQNFFFLSLQASSLKIWTGIMKVRRFWDIKTNMQWVDKRFFEWKIIFRKTYAGRPMLKKSAKHRPIYIKLARWVIVRDFYFYSSHICRIQLIKIHYLKTDKK